MRLPVAVLVFSLGGVAYAEDPPAPAPPEPSPTPMPQSPITVPPPPTTTPPPATVPQPAAPAKPPAPLQYSIPWQLRPVLAVNVLRSDNAVAFYEDKDGNLGGTVASMIVGSYRVLPQVAPFVRLGILSNWPPGAASETVFVNPQIGINYAFAFRHDLKLNLYFTMALPLGAGGGDNPDPATLLAVKSGIFARSAMDNAMFNPNYLTISPGIDFAWVAHGFTIQAEATLLQLVRVRGHAVDVDAARTNMTLGLHFGYFFIPQLSVGTELRYQVWLSTPTPVANDPTGTTRDTVTIAAGVRGHFRIGKTTWIRPGLSYTRGLDNPMAAANYNIVQVDVPLLF